MDNLENFYSEKRVAEITSLSRTTLWRLRRKGQFPRPVELSAGRKAYPSSVIDRWIKERMEGQPHAG